MCWWRVDVCSGVLSPVYFHDGNIVMTLDYLPLWFVLEEEKMVFYFTSNVVDPPVTLFMGLDKYENEDLIKAGKKL
jgi:hypothetical protein